MSINEKQKILNSQNLVKSKPFLSINPENQDTALKSNKKNIFFSKNYNRFIIVINFLALFLIDIHKG